MDTIHNRMHLHLPDLMVDHYFGEPQPVSSLRSRPASGCSHPCREGSATSAAAHCGPARTGTAPAKSPSAAACSLLSSLDPVAVAGAKGGAFSWLPGSSLRAGCGAARLQSSAL